MEAAGFLCSQHQERGTLVKQAHVNPVSGTPEKRHMCFGLRFKMMTDK